MNTTQPLEPERPHDWRHEEREYNPQEAHEAIRQATVNCELIKARATVRANALDQPHLALVPA